MENKPVPPILRAIIGLALSVPCFMGGYYAIPAIREKIEEKSQTARSFANVAQVVDAAEVRPELEGQPVLVTGRLVAASPVSDTEFGVEFLDALRGDRRVSMYQNDEIWEYDAVTETDEMVGIDQVWSSEMIDCPSKPNPKFPVGSKRFTANEAQLGAFTIPGSLTSSLKANSSLTVPQLDLEKFGSLGLWVTADGGKSWELDRGKPGLDVGDCRVEFTQLDSATVTVSGEQSGNTIVACIDAEGHQTYALQSGTVTPKDLKGEAKSDTQLGMVFLGLLGWGPLALGVLFAGVGIGLISNEQPGLGCLGSLLASGLLFGAIWMM